VRDAPGAERLVAAQAELKRACSLLIVARPESLTDLRDTLARAVSELTDFRSQLGVALADSGNRSKASALRSDIETAKRLLQNLARFYVGWERILGTMSSGYTAAGDPAQVVRVGRLCCRG